jgi:hypothetical protein
MGYVNISDFVPPIPDQILIEGIFPNKEKFFVSPRFLTIENE